jgi:hypothetical protein
MIVSMTARVDVVTLRRHIARVQSQASSIAHDNRQVTHRDRLAYASSSRRLDLAPREGGRVDLQFIEACLKPRNAVTLATSFRSGSQ